MVFRRKWHIESGCHCHCFTHVTNPSFPICLHESVSLPSDSCLCVVQHITHLCILLNLTGCGTPKGSSVAPFSCESWTSDARQQRLAILTWAFHSPLDHTTGDCMASHLWRPTSISLHQRKHHMLSINIFTPPPMELQSQRPSGRCNNSSFSI